MIWAAAKEMVQRILEQSFEVLCPSSFKYFCHPLPQCLALPL